MIRISAWLAIVFAACLAIVELARNWGDWQWAPFWIVDYMASALLVFGGQRALNRGTLRWLTGAWGFTAAMFYMSFFSHIYNLQTRSLVHTGPIEETTLTVIIGVLLVIAFAGFFLALAGQRPSENE